MLYGVFCFCLRVCCLRLCFVRVRFVMIMMVLWECCSILLAGGLSGVSWIDGAWGLLEFLCLV